jgi:hypothetical protein
MIARHTGKLAVVSKANRALDHTRKTALAYQWHSRGAREADDSRGIAKLRLLLADIVAKVENRTTGESRESRFLDAPAAARLSRANTKVGGRFGMKGCAPSCRHTRNGSAVFKIFVLHPKKTFATISARNRHADAIAVCPLLGEQQT